MKQYNQLIITGCAMSGAVGGLIVAFERNANVKNGVVLIGLGVIIGAVAGYVITQFVPGKEEGTFDE